MDGISDPTNKIAAAKPAARKTRTAWKGEWDTKASKYVGTGEYAGQDRPQDHAPAWWRKTQVINGDRYFLAYADATYHQDLLKEFWYATEKQIKSAHDLTNEWCKDNGHTTIRKKPQRKGRVSAKVAAKMYRLGIIKAAKK